jgi:hypothetical protein
MWTLLVFDPQGRELRRLPLGEAPLGIGRGKDRDLVLDAPSVSRHHARLEARGASVIVEDLGSSNGTLLNGRRIERPEAVQEGDELAIADFVLRLRREQPPAPAPDPDKTMLGSLHKPLDPPPAAGWDQPQIRVPEQAPPPAEAPAAPESAAGSWNSASEILKRQVQSIRNFREESQTGSAGRLGTFEQGWDRVITSMRELQDQLRGNPRVLLFGISRNNREVTAKIADPSSKRGHAYLILSPEHPEGKYRDQVTVWLREFGEPDANYDDPAEAMRYFVQRIAARLA